MGYNGFKSCYYIESVENYYEFMIEYKS